MEDYLSKLNDEQREAVMATEGMIRVIAGAGSGKTRALSSRFAFLVNEIGILPGNILCVTFTNKAANEMRQRIHNLTGDNDTGYINTFHGFCVSVLQEDSHVVQYPKSFLVLDNSDIDAMLQTIYEERGLTLRDMTFSNARDMIEIIKLKERPKYYLDMIGMSLEALLEKYQQATEVKDIIFYGYLYQEKKCFGLDYNDLIKYTLYIFSRNETVRLKWQKRLEYIMIDEFQDIDDLQYELMNVLCGYHKNLFIVGDPDQTIYSWRGANGKYLMEFDQTHPDVRTVLMMRNYRSTPEILAAVNSLIDKNEHRIRKDLIPTLPEGSRVVCHRADHAADEAKWIADRIRQLEGEGVRLNEIAVLYRAHYVTRSVEEGLRKAKIPYTIYSGVQFFGRAEIKDALAYLRMIAYRDDLSFLRICNVPKRNLGKRRIAFLKEAAQRQGITLYEALKEHQDAPEMKGTKAGQFIHLIENYASSYEGRRISDLLSSILENSGYEKMLRTEGSQERLDNLAELKQSIYEYETTCGEETELTHYLSHVSLFSNADTAEHQDKVKLMTVHAAKGLEFPYVILCGMSEGIFPSGKIRTRDAMEEERRLAFVAMTRAEKALYLTMAEGRNIDGSPRYPSRFVLDIDQDLLDYTAPPGEGLIKEAREYIHQSDEILKKEESIVTFRKGQRVRHFIFGAGTVLDVDPIKKAHIINFDEIGTPRAISFRAKLTEEEGGGSTEEESCGTAEAKGGGSTMKEQVKEAFHTYVAAYNADDPKIRLKIDHSYRVADLCERIAATVPGADAEFAWLIGMLHDIGRFEQVRRFHTFVDAQSVDHAQLGADLLFRQGLLEQILPGGLSPEKRSLMEVSIRNHNAYRIQPGLDEQEMMYCSIIRDADKVDIFRVISETPVGQIYNVSMQQLQNDPISEAVKTCFYNHTAVLRSLRKTYADRIVGQVCLVFELVYPESLAIARQQGFLKKILQFESNNPDTAAWFEYMRKELEL